ncbi:MAG TPA: M4 family metallopeptidase [Gammaproteobacteria bacterium]|nr:M4 family metallopeptidase [Gammaproteobacteria bacterium]
MIYKIVSIFFLISLLCLSPVQAAQLKNLRQQMPFSLELIKNQTDLKEVRRELDDKNIVHLRLQETYAGYPVWGGEVMMHFPDRGRSKLGWRKLLFSPALKMNGRVYLKLEADLEKAPAFIFGKARAEQALAAVLALNQQKTGTHQEFSDKKTTLVIYVDRYQKAHWTYWLQFKQQKEQGLPAKPAYLIDATTLQVYQSWDEIKTREPLRNVLAGGCGGNLKGGKFYYDGLPGHYSALKIQRDLAHELCYLENEEVVVKDVRHQNLQHQYLKAMFVCSTPSAKHSQLFWNGSLDAVNGAYSPSNDALFIGKIIKDLYAQWYKLPALTNKEGKPLKLIMRVHEDLDNAYWDGEQMTFGDGGSSFYPFISLGVGAHEISHGFTEQHANLIYFGQSGGLNEAFSDMAAQAAEFFVNGNNHWQIGAEIIKEKSKALRYMDHPALDCEAVKPGEPCSIEHIKDYNEELNVHFSSGIYNRVFYLIATAPGWSTRQAFDLMVQANRYYWTATVDFKEAACGVMDAVRDYGYSQQAVVAAFKSVGIEVSSC